MDELILDDRIRRSVDVTASSALLIDATGLPRARPGTSGLGWSVVALVGCLAIAAVVLWLGDHAAGPGSPESAAVDTSAGLVQVRLTDSSLALDLAIAGRGPVEIVATSGGRSRPFVAQLVCGPDEPLTGLIVLFGYLGSNQPAKVKGLAAGDSSTGRDGSFLFVTTSVPAAGAEWSVTSGSAKFGGPVALWGIRDILPASTKSTCVISDPSTQPQKP